MITKTEIDIAQELVETYQRTLLVGGDRSYHRSRLFIYAQDNLSLWLEILELAKRQMRTDEIVNQAKKRMQKPCTRAKRLS